MTRILTTVAMVLCFVGVAPAAEPTYKVVIGNKGTGKGGMLVQAQGTGNALKGTGKLVGTNGSVYPMVITSGSIVKGHYAVLNGTVGNGASFRLYGDSVTGTIDLIVSTSPTGSGRPIISHGTVVIQAQ